MMLLAIQVIVALLILVYASRWLSRIGAQLQEVRKSQAEITGSLSCIERWSAENLPILIQMASEIPDELRKHRDEIAVLRKTLDEQVTGRLQ